MGFLAHLACGGVYYEGFLQGEITENSSLYSASYLPGSSPFVLGLEQAPEGAQAAHT